MATHEFAGMRLGSSSVRASKSWVLGWEIITAPRGFLGECRSWYIITAVQSEELVQILLQGVAQDCTCQ